MEDEREVDQTKKGFTTQGERLETAVHERTCYQKW